MLTRTTGIVALVFLTLTGCLGGGGSGDTSPAPVTSTSPSTTRPATPEDLVNDIVLPKAEFPASYQARQRTDRGLESYTNGLCGYDATDERRVARVQVYYTTEAEDATASNEVVAYENAATAKKALLWNQRLTRYCDRAAQDRNGIDALRDYTCPEEVLARAACLRFAVVPDEGATTHTYKIVQVRGKVLTATYANAATPTAAVPVASELAERSAARIREKVDR